MKNKNFGVYTGVSKTQSDSIKECFFAALEKVPQKEKIIAINYIDRGENGMGEFMVCVINTEQLGVESTPPVFMPRSEDDLLCPNCEGFGCEVCNQNGQY